MRVRISLIGLFLIMPAVCAPACRAERGAGREELPPLGEAIARAFAHNPEVAIADARVAHAEAKLRAARRGWFQPEVRVYAGGNALTGSNRVGLPVSQDLVRLLTLNHDEVQQATHELTLARQELTHTQEALIRQVHEARLTLQRAERLVGLRAQAVLQREQLLVLARATFENGSSPLEQLLAATQAHTQAEDDLWQAQGELHHARVVWAQLLGDPVPTDDAIP